MDGPVRAAVLGGQQPRLWKQVTVAVSLAAYENRVSVNSGALGDYIITLPPLGECEDRGFYIIYCTVHGGSDVTVESAESDAGGKLYTSGKLTQVADFLILYTDGVRWYEIKELTT